MNGGLAQVANGFTLYRLVIASRPSSRLCDGIAARGLLILGWSSRCPIQTQGRALIQDVMFGSLIRNFSWNLENASTVGMMVMGIAVFMGSVHCHPRSVLSLTGCAILMHFHHE